MAWSRGGVRPPHCTRAMHTPAARGEEAYSSYHRRPTISPQRVIELGVTSRIVELLLHASPTVVQPAMRTIGNIATGDDLQTQVAIFHGALPALLALLTSGRRPTRKEACWTLSNITAGNRDQIQAVIDCNMVQAVVQLLSDSDAEVR